MIQNEATELPLRINYTWAVLNHYSEFNGHPLSSPILRRIFALFFKPGNSERDRNQTTTLQNMAQLFTCTSRSKVTHSRTATQMFCPEKSNGLKEGSKNSSLSGYNLLSTFNKVISSFPKQVKTNSSLCANTPIGPGSCDSDQSVPLSSGFYGPLSKWRPLMTVIHETNFSMMDFQSFHKVVSQIVSTPT